MAGEELSEKLKDIYDRVSESLDYSINSVVTIRQGELDRLAVIQRELSEVQKQVLDVIDALEAAEEEYHRARKELMNISRTGDEVEQRTAYDRAEHLMRMKATFEERERNLRHRREYLALEERRARGILEKSGEMINKFRLAQEILNTRVNELSQLSGEKGMQTLAEAYRLAERDSRALARDLHDGPAQSFSGAILLLELSERLFEVGQTKRALQELSKVKPQMQEAMADIRSFLFQLNPKGLEDGLDVAIERFAKQAGPKYGIDISVVSDGSVNRVTMSMRSNIFKIIHQAVVNAIKNSQAEHIQVIISTGIEMFRAKVIDDGRGFDVEAARLSARERGSYGLFNMEERTRIAGGALRIDSAPEKGTVISIQIPLNKE